MKCGIIDIGTNTVRAVVFKGEKGISDNTVSSRVLKYTKDGILSDEGILWLAECIKENIKFFEKSNTEDIHAFATSAMRDVKNFYKVHEYIKENTGIEIRLLSEEEEALCDFYALKRYASSGVGIDLGGGSCQLISFSNGEILKSASYKIGVKRLLERFGEYDFEDNRVIDFIDDIVDIEGAFGDTLYVMGGSAKAIYRIYDLCFDKGEDILIEHFDDVKRFIKNNKAVVKKMIGKREKTVLFAMDVIFAVSEKVSAKRIKVIKEGVREGYLRGFLTERK